MQAAGKHKSNWWTKHAISPSADGNENNGALTTFEALIVNHTNHNQIKPWFS
jgi:hypothetical protein